MADVRTAATAADREVVAEAGAGAGLLLRVVARGAELGERVAQADALAREFEESRRRLGRAREVERRRLLGELGGATTERLAAFRAAVTATGEALEEGISDPDDDAAVQALDIVRHEPRKAKLTAAVNDSFGFGGHNIALVFTTP